MNGPPVIGVIGLGEVGRTLVGELHSAGSPLLALDTRRPAAIREVNGVNLRCLDDPAEFAAQVDAVMVVVTGAAAPAVAQQTTPHLRPGTGYADWTSKSPAARDEVAQRCDAADLSFTDIGILGTVTWPDQRIPLVASGPGATATAATLAPTRFTCRVLSERPCSAEIKLVRSSFTKGLNALLLETMLAAELAGVRSEVQPGLVEFMDSGFERIMDLLLASSFAHAERRAQEAEEVSNVMATISPEPRIARATAATLADLHRTMQSWASVPAVTTADEAIALLASAYGAPPPVTSPAAAREET